MFVGWEIRDQTEKRALELYRIFKYHNKNDLTIRVWCCHKCTSLDHKVSNCKEELAHDPNLDCANSICQQTGHTSDHCELQNCQTCFSQGHSANECLSNLMGTMHRLALYLYQEWQQMIMFQVWGTRACWVPVQCTTRPWTSKRKRICRREWPGMLQMQIDRTPCKGLPVTIVRNLQGESHLAGYSPPRNCCQLFGCPRCPNLSRSATRTFQRTLYHQGRRSCNTATTFTYFSELSGIWRRWGTFRSM